MVLRIKKTKIYREASKNKRSLYKKRLRKISKRRRIYIDESGIHEHVYQTHGWSKKGVRIVERVSGQRFKRTNLIAGYCKNQPLAQKIFDGSCTADFFEEWFSSEFLPAIPTDGVIIMDNARFHRKKQLSILLEKFNFQQKADVQLLFLPPYSPDLNPIEHYWAHVKNKVRKEKGNYDDFIECLKFCFV